MKYFSVVIPAFKGQENCQRLVVSLCRQSLSMDEFEVIIVGDVDGERIPPTLPYKVCSLENRGANYARKIGEENSSGRFVFFIDDDCFIDSEDFLKKWKEFLESHPEVDIAGGTYEISGSWFFDGAYNSIIEMWQRTGSETSPHLVGGHLIVRREVFATVHFDENIRYGGTETDFCSRAMSKGFNLHLNTSFRIGHEAKVSFSQVLNKAYLQGKRKNKHKLSAPLSRQIMIALKGLKRPWYLPIYILFWVSSRVGSIIGRWK